MSRYFAQSLAVVALIAATPARADVVIDWAELQTSIHNATSDPDGAFDANRHQAYGRAMLAMFEAANAIDRRYESYLKLAPAAAGASQIAAISTAARDVLVKLYPSQSKTIEDAYVIALAEVPAGASLDAGVATGRAAAVAALAAGGIDPARPLGVYRPASMPGKWAPSQVPFAPQVMATRAWFLKTPQDFRLPPPVALTSVTWAKSLDEVRRLGAKESKERSAADTVKAQFWAFYNLDPMLRQIGSQPGRSLVQNARMLALLSMAADDMDIVLAEGKTDHMFWRPLNAIRLADRDGNAATAPDVTWEPLLRTPSQPEYPCGHCTFASLVETVLTPEGPPPPGGYLFTNDRMPGIKITVPTLKDYTEAVSLSRIHAGVHYRFTNEVSIPMGRRVAELAISRFARQPPK